MDQDTRIRSSPSAPQTVPAAAYERPEIVDYGSLSELTLSGINALSDTFGGVGGGGS